MEMNIKLVLPILALLVALTGSVNGQTTPQHRTLVVNGHTGDATVLEVNGRAYVDFETLARIANGSLAFNGQQIILTLPPSAPSIPASSVGSDHAAATNDLSRDFVTAAVEEVTLLREWVSPLANAIQNGFPVTETWVAGYRDRAAGSHKLASLAVHTDGDRHAFQLLTNEFEAVRAWSDKLVRARQSMSAGNYALSPDALRNDPLSQKIISCAHFIEPMLASGTFQDDPSCH